MDLSPPDDITPVAQVIGYDWEPVPRFGQGKVWWESVRVVVGVMGECEGSGRSDGRV